MSSIPCAWCGKPASRVYPARPLRAKLFGADDLLPRNPPDCYLCPDCDALVRAGQPLPAGVATFSVAVRGDS